MLYSLQLAVGSIFDSDTNSNKPTSKTDGDQLNTVSPSEGSANNVVSTNSDLKQNSDNSTNSSQQLNLIVDSSIVYALLYRCQ